MSELKGITAEEALLRAWICLDHVRRYGLAQMDHLDAEKIVTACTLLEMLREANKHIAHHPPIVGQADDALKLLSQR